MIFQIANKVITKERLQEFWHKKYSKRFDLQVLKRVESVSFWDIVEQVGIVGRCGPQYLVLKGIVCVGNSFLFISAERQLPLEQLHL